MDSLDGKVGIGLAGEKRHLNRRIPVDDASEELNAAETGHYFVQHYNVGPDLTDEFPPGFGIVAGRDIEFRAGENTGDKLRNLFIIIDHD